MTMKAVCGPSGRTAIAKLWRDDRGSIGILMALLILPIAGIVGLAFDYARAINARSQLQLAADGAAISAASRPNLPDSERIALAEEIFRLDRKNNFLVANVEANVQHTGTGDQKAVVVKATTNLETTFAGVLAIQAMPISVESQAMLGSTGSTTPHAPACLLALENNDYGLKINGGGTGSHINANCGVYVNSASSSAIFGNDKGTLTSTYTCVHGDFDDDPTYSPMPSKGCNRLADPFAGILAAPTVGDCNFNNTKVNSNKTKTLSPGVHCGGIDIGSSATVTFQPGVYVIKDGQFKIGSSAIVTGDGVFFYLTGNNARIDWGSSAVITFRGPTSGTYKGMFAWAAESLSNAHRIGCHSTSILEGAFYSPGTEIDIQSWGEVGASADWTVWVVKSVQISSHAQLKVKANYTGSLTPLPDGLLSRMTPPETQTRSARLLK